MKRVKGKISIFFMLAYGAAVMSVAIQIVLRGKGKLKYLWKFIEYGVDTIEKFLPEFATGLTLNEIFIKN